MQLGSMTLSLFYLAAAADNKSGAALFEEHCGGCHSPSEISASLKGRGEEQERATAKMRDFLLRHGDADEAQARAIIEYLRQEANRK